MNAATHPMVRSNYISIACAKAALRTAFITLCFGLATAQAQTLSGRVIGVSDGDTITVLDGSRVQHKIRLSGIDAPESGQAFGNRSKQALSDCAFGKTAMIEGDKTDRYGRTVARVVVNGVDCNLRQIELGLAWHFKKYEREQPMAERRAYATAELVARENKRGLWEDERAAAEAPWEWRANHAAEIERKEMVGQCDCAIDAPSGVCQGKRGGRYCVTQTGSRRYFR